MNWDHDRYGFESMHNSGYGIVMMIFGILLLSAFFVLIFRAMDRPQHVAARKNSKSQSQSALEIIDIRLAKGEMSKEDYVTARELLDPN
jgi:uncharacterized membrane protein